ncbi:MAG: OmpH family outer membrane protein [Candidatus Omnitrophica bacterium]|nr:OmpH family outer membrane protein [Candidatus Omnitrophota bacterium]
MKKFIFSILCVVLLCPRAYADELTELKTMFQKMQVEMNAMAQRIEQLEQEKQRQSAQKQHEIDYLQDRVDQLERADKGTGKSLLSTLNPEVSIIGDVVYKTTDEDEGEGDNDFNAREMELAFSANVDTYARGDVVVAIENEDGNTEVALEEGYLTLLETPLDGLQAKVGKFRPFFGKANRMHLHQLPWVDYPLAVQNFLGEEGVSEAGVSLSYLIPNPADIFSELTFEAINNGSTVLGGGEENETVYLGHLKNFFEVTPDTSLELGISHAFGKNDVGDGADTFLTGVDVTLNTRLFDNRRTTSHTEVLLNKREQVTENDVDSWGMFTSLEQQLTDRWWAFGRYDFSQMPTASEVDTHAYSVGLTFAQSEYVFWRAMYTHTDNETSEDVNTVWLQMDFSIGPHKPHAYR